MATSSSSHRGVFINDLIVGGRYKLIKEIGSGSFGIIYLGCAIDNGEVSYQRLQDL